MSTSSSQVLAVVQLGPASRAFYEIYTEGSTGSKYKQFLNAVFDQPDTVINSANLWIRYTDLASPGNLYARKISTNYRLSCIQFAIAQQRSVSTKTETVFRDILITSLLIPLIIHII